MLEPGADFRIGNHINIMTEYRYIRNVDNTQYVTQEPLEQDTRYILGRIGQQTHNFILRFNYNLTPDISLQYYGSPFISTGIYHDFKRVDEAGDYDIEQRYHAFTDAEITFDESSQTYTVTEGPVTYTFDNPDFSFREFRSNLVARWEYRPGSTLYLVWGHNRSGMDNTYNPALDYNIGELYGVPATNVFMVKMSFWLGI